MTTRRAAVLGTPIAHSLSPVLHGAAYAALGLSGWSYGRAEVSREALPGFLAGLGPQWAGLSLTMPLKRAVLPLLAGITPVAAAVGAVNTVLPAAGGGWLGDNTDVPGIVAALAGRGLARVPDATILGGGATAASALAALARVCDGPITVYARDPARAAPLRAVGERLRVAPRIEPWERAPGGLGAALVIATTPAGAADALAQAVPPAPGVLFDVLYDPWPTALAARWAACGGEVIGGLDLLVHQAALQVELMTGRSPAPLAAMRAAVGGGPAIVLVGPMGVGKSTVGRILAGRLGVSFRDTDDDIVAGQGRDIARIFAEAGEPAFRALEKRAVARALAEHDGVLALGGGSVLDADTRALLTGLPVLYLTMSPGEAAARPGVFEGRPLLAPAPGHRRREDPDVPGPGHRRREEPEVPAPGHRRREEPEVPAPGRRQEMPDPGQSRELPEVPDPSRRWREVADARRHLYAAVAAAVVGTDGCTPEEVADAALADERLRTAAGWRWDGSDNAAVTVPGR